MFERKYPHLSDALAAVQCVIEDAILDSTNPHYRSRYASLLSVLRAVRKELALHGISLIQGHVASAPGTVSVETALLYGEERVSFVITVPLEKPTPQGVVAATTYARRCALAAICGIAADDDDDGESIEPRNEARREPQPVQPSGRHGTPRQQTPAPSVDLPDAPKDCSYERHGDSVRIRTPYYDAFRADIRAARIGASWNPENKFWSVDLSALPTAHAIVSKHFGAAAAAPQPDRVEREAAAVEEIKAQAKIVFGDGSSGPNDDDIQF